MAGGRIPDANPDVGKNPEQIAKEKIAENAKNAEVEASQRAWNQWYYNDFLIRSGAYKPITAKDMWEETVAPIKSTLSDEDGIIQSNGIPRSLKTDTYYRLSGDYDIEMYVSREKDPLGKSLMTLRATSNLSGFMPGTIAKREDFYRKGYMQLALQGDTRVVINFPKEAKSEFIKLDEIQRMMRIAKECKLEIDFGDKIQEFMQRTMSSHEASALDNSRIKQNQWVCEDRDATLNSSQYYQNRKHQEIKIKTNSELGSIKQNFSDAKNNIEISLNDTSPNANPAAAIKNAETTFKALETRMKNALAETEIFLKQAKTQGQKDEFKGLSDAAFTQITADYEALKTLLKGKLPELDQQITEKSTELNRIPNDVAEGTPDHNRKKELEAQKAKLVSTKETIQNGDSGLLPKLEATFKEIEKAKNTFDQAHEAAKPAPGAPAPIAGH